MKQILVTTLMLVTHIIQSSATFSDLDPGLDPDSIKEELERRPLTPLLYAGHPATPKATKRLLAAAQQSQNPTPKIIDLSSATDQKKSSLWRTCCCLFLIRKRSSQDSGLPITPNTSTSSMGSYGEE